MRKKSGFTIVEQAIVLVPDFEKVVRELEQQVTLTRDPKSPSRSSFKHMVYGLRYYYRLLGMNKKAIALPSLKGNTKLPVILNQSELKELFAAPALLKQRIVLTLNIVTLKELLGHADITTTMIYLHTAQCPLIKPHSPLEHPKGLRVLRLWRGNRSRGSAAYLGQYTHRVAITNQRILNIYDGKVKFIAKDYRDGAKKKPVTLYGVEFLRRFTLHILPSRFVKIRRFGIYNHTVKRNLELQFVPEEKPDIDTLIKKKAPKETALQRFERLTGVNPCQCPVCKTGRMVTVRELPRIRAPDLSLQIAQSHSLI